MISTLKEVREALGKAKRQITHANVAPHQCIADAITKLDALIAQRESGDDGLAQQYTKLSAHCAMLEDKLATLTSAIGAKQMSDFVAKHGAQEKAEPVMPAAFYDRPSNSIKKIDVSLHHGQFLYTAPQPAAEPVGWQPIETAPKSEIILLGLPLIGNIREGDRRVYEGRWHEEQSTWTSVNGFLLLGSATHWMPLPAPPVNKIGAKPC